MRLSRPLLVRLALLVGLVAIAIALFVRTVPRLQRYRAVDLACAAVERGDWSTALETSEDLAGTDPEGLRAAQCRCLALLQTGAAERCADLMENLIEDPRTGDWLPSPELTSLVVARREERGAPGAAAELAHRGATAYPEDALLLLQELNTRTRTEDEASVMEEMERRLPHDEPAASVLRLRLAERHLLRDEWPEARELIGQDPKRFPRSLDRWFAVHVKILAGLGDMEGLETAFDEWRQYGEDPLWLSALHAVVLSAHQLSDPSRPTLQMLREVAAQGENLEDQELLQLVYQRLVGTLVVDQLYDEALATYDQAIQVVGDLGMITREDILRSESRALLGEEQLEALRGTIRLHVADLRPGDTLLVTPPLDEPVDSEYVSIDVPSSGVAALERGVGTWPQRWVLRDSQGRVAGSGAVWPRPEAPVDIDAERRRPTSTTTTTTGPSGPAGPAGPAATPADRANRRRRVFQVVLDCADWRLIEYGRARGELPFFDQAIRRGRRAVLDSVPPFTAVAVAKLVFPTKVGTRSFFDMVHQLGAEVEGLNFVGRNPFAALEWVLPEERGIFETFAEHGYSTVNLLHSHGALQAGRQAQVLGPGDVVRQLAGYSASRPLTADEARLLGEPEDLAIDFLQEMAADFDMLDRLAKDSSINFVALRVASLDLMTHSHFQTMNRTGQDDGNPVLYRTYRYMDSRLAEVAEKLGPNDVLVVMSDHGIRTPMEHDRRALFVAVGDGVLPGRVEGTPPIREVAGWIADLLGVPTEWPGAGTASWIAGPSPDTRGMTGFVAENKAEEPEQTLP